MDKAGRDDAMFFAHGLLNGLFVHIGLGRRLGREIVFPRLGAWRRR